MWPCLSGPFFPPKGYQLVSPVYLITPAFDFLKEVRLSIAHYAAVDSSSDCDSMTFISSSSSPKYAPHAKYEFKTLSGSLFQRKEHHGVIFLKHFCNTAIAQQTSASGDTASQKEAKNGDYSYIYIYIYIYQYSSVHVCNAIYFILTPLNILQQITPYNFINLSFNWPYFQYHSAIQFLLRYIAWYKNVYYQ